MKKLMLVIPMLSTGGAERVILHLFRHIDRAKFNPIYLVLFEMKGEFMDYVPKDIQVISLKKGIHKYGLQWLIFVSLAKILQKERPDVIVSFMWYPNLITSLARAISRVNTRIILSERISLSFSFGFVGNILRSLGMRLFYKKADAIIVNSKKMMQELIEKTKLNEEKIKVIYNPIDLKEVNALSAQEVSLSWFKENVPVIVAMGRLTAQKGFNYLINAVKILTDRGINCRLCILGEGVDKEKLQNQAVNSGIQEKVTFLGVQRNPYKYLARATIFVLSSLHEGFPNALLEAMALGIPSIATRCPTGPDELITDGEDGLLVPPRDEKALADAIERLLKDEKLRTKLGANAKKKTEAFDVNRIVKEYERVLEQGCE